MAANPQTGPSGTTSVPLASVPLASAPRVPAPSGVVPDHAVPDAHGLNLFRADPDAAALFRLHLPPALFAHLEPTFDRLGALAGGHLDDLASIADKHPPTLSVRTRQGIDENRIHKHPAYVELERVAFGELGLAAMSHRPGALGWPETMPPAAKYALTYLFVQAEFGLCCPVSMTDSLARTLRRFGDPALVEQVLPQVASLDFDDLRQGAMFMTEQGAGSDVAATATVAVPCPDGSWQLHGDKWFCSNPDAGFAMVLARSEPEQTGMGGVSLFLLPQRLADGSHNRYRILRLKDKLGTRSMASGEIRMEGATAYLVGERGRGFVQMADMVNNSRLSNGVRAAGLMRRALTEAIWIARHRVAFGARIAELPLMQRQLMKMTVATEQARAMVFETARALHAADREREASGTTRDTRARTDEARLARILTPLIKFRACRDARKVTGDAMEVRGGCGYIEEFSDARLLRDAHLGSIWEGTSNIVALDVLRAIRREGALPPLRARVETLLAEGVPFTSAADEARARDAIDRAFALAQKAADQDADHLARTVGTALYHVFTMAALRREAKAAGLPRRALIADRVLAHRLAPRDPLAADDLAHDADAAAVIGLA